MACCGQSVPLLHRQPAGVGKLLESLIVQINLCYLNCKLYKSVSSRYTAQV